MWIDTHCHLDAAEFDADRADAAMRACAAGVETIVIPAVARSNFEVVCALAHSIQGGTYALGIHPMCAAQSHDSDLEALRTLVRRSLDDPRFVAVGEIGLDFFDPDAIAASERQQAIYVAQLRIAEEFGLPVLLHVRRSQDQVLKQLRRIRVVGGCAHAFNGSRQQADAFVGLGFKLGIGGAMTFERALQIRRIARELPLESLVLETDSPDIAPAWVRPARNEPAELPRIGAVLADLRATTIEEVARTTSNAAVAAIPRLAAFRASMLRT